ncbi:hypothetical protein FD754_023709 [Muntiacus muntjak]|uniref:PA domain-containing protein n=1 Tax=Muntiacus muntjak TaxID=9888 RepID=A0A5N3USP8_MUNMU|nr:hypothetical protein FD754_023710 [Muntiacus muntjak]KAB0339721.1 hypothetical protein FD754_023709 [Muntiacus muntjak]
MGPLLGAGIFCRGGCGFSRLLAWCFLLVLSPQTPGSRGAEAVWTAYLNVSWRVPHTGVNRTVWELSEEGVYGQDSPLEPVAGVLVPPDGPGALNACNPHTNFTVPTVPGDWGSVQVSWLALIQRGGGCTFADKIHLAYERGASGAVIFNFPGTRNEVIPMSHPAHFSPFCASTILPFQLATYMQGFDFALCIHLILCGEIVCLSFPICKMEIFTLLAVLFALLIPKSNPRVHYNLWSKNDFSWILVAKRGLCLNCPSVELVLIIHTPTYHSSVTMKIHLFQVIELTGLQQ